MRLGRWFRGLCLRLAFSPVERDLVGDALSIAIEDGYWLDESARCRAAVRLRDRIRGRSP